MDAEVVARQLIRAIRAHRSQVQLSRRLGYASNVVYAWEAGRRWPTAAETLRACHRTGVPVAERLERFLGRAPGWLSEGVDAWSPESVAALLDALRGDASVTDLAARAGLGRSRVSRWLSGRTEPRLPEFLQLVEAASARMVDLVAALVGPESVPAVAPLWARMEARRRGAGEYPWTQAILRALELSDYAALPAHEPGWIARRLGISEAEEGRCVAFLRDTGQVRWDGHRFRGDPLAVDTGRTPEVGPRLKAHWAGVAAARVEAGAPGQFSYNVFVVSRADFEAIREAHLAYFRAMRSIVAASTPGEVVAVANVQLFALDAQAPTPGPVAEGRVV